MAGSEMTKTVEGIALRCMLVGIDDTQAAVCAASLMPIQMVRIADVKEACARISTILPIMVVAPRKLGEGALAELREFAETCACEVCVLDDVPQNETVERLHDYLRRADKRRASRDRRDD